MQLKEIGIIKKDEQGFFIQLDPVYAEAMTGLDGFSHLHILWWANQLDSPEMRSITLTEKPYKPGPDQLGIFATRSPLRPNPICTTIISVSDLKPAEGIIRTWYIDAEPGTPVLDIKPYLPCSDKPANSQAPHWSSILPNTIEDSASYDWEGYFNF